MTDEKDIRHRSSAQDRHLHRLSNISSRSRLNSMKQLSENPYDSSSFHHHHSMDFVSVLSLSHRHPVEKDKALSRSYASDFHPISYSYRSPISSTVAPVIALPTSTDEPTSQRQIILPSLTPRGSKSARKFPSLTSISLSPFEARNTPIPTVRNSLNSINGSTTLNKMPMVTNERKKKVQLPEHLRCPE